MYNHIEGLMASVRIFHTDLYHPIFQYPEKIQIRKCHFQTQKLLVNLRKVSIAEVFE